MVEGKVGWELVFALKQIRCGAISDTLIYAGIVACYGQQTQIWHNTTRINCGGN